MIIYSVAENNAEVLTKAVSEIPLDINTKPVVRDCCRAGIMRDGSPRSVTLTSSS